MKVGYGRCSTNKQETKAQEAELLKYGCEKIFVDVASGAQTKRKELERALDMLRPGDEFVCWKLDRLSRSLKDLLFYVERIGVAKATFTSLTERLDTKGPAGVALMQILGVFAQFERAMIAERTKLGVEQAIADGAINGRPSNLSPEQQQHLIDMINAGNKTQAQMAKVFKVHRSVVCRLIAKQRVMKREELAA
jgi:DNA invertase Pin-like site-specific DNA recombinase